MAFDDDSHTLKRNLRKRKVTLHAVRVVIETFHLYAANDPHNLQRRRRVVRAEPNPFTYGILVGPISFRKQLIDNDYIRPGYQSLAFVRLAEVPAGDKRSIVMLVEVSSAQQRNVHRAKVIGRYRTC